MYLPPSSCEHIGEKSLLTAPRLWTSEAAEAPIYLYPETARAAHASMTVALKQLDVIPELRLCFSNTKTSNAMAFLNLRTVCLPAHRAPFMAGT
jgi:hypothetical protein